MDKKIYPVNVLKTLGISDEQYAQMGSGQVLKLVRIAYSLQTRGSSNNPSISNKKK